MGAAAGQAWTETIQVANLLREGITSCVHQGSPRGCPISPLISDHHPQAPLPCSRVRPPAGRDRFFIPGGVAVRRIRRLPAARLVPATGENGTELEADKARVLTELHPAAWSGTRGRPAVGPEPVCWRRCTRRGIIERIGSRNARDRWLWSNCAAYHVRTQGWRAARTVSRAAFRVRVARRSAQRRCRPGHPLRRFLRLPPRAVTSSARSPGSSPESSIPGGVPKGAGQRTPSQAVRRVGRGSVTVSLGTANRRTERWRP